MATKKPQPAYLSQPSEFDLGAIDAFLKLPLPPTEEPPKPRSLVRMGADAGISLLKGAIAVPEAAVGLADLATGGRVGKFLENEGGAVGFRPEQAKRMLDELYSPEQQAAFQRVQQAEGVVDTAVAAVQNPSVIGHAVLESLPSIGAGGVVGRGAMAVAPRMGVMAGALGEGTVAAGSAAEQVRQQTEDGLLTGQQAALAGGSGVVTGLLGVLGGKVAQRLGINDVDTMVAGAARDPATAKGVVRRVLEGAFAEGILEELPQSVQEQVAQNLALDKPLDEGVDQAAVLGALSGGVMGFGANLLPRRDRMGAPVAPPPSGPMGRAVQAGGPAPTAPAMPTEPAGAAPVDAPVDPVLAPYADEQVESPAVQPSQPAGLGAVMDPETGEIIMPEQPAPDEVPTIPTEKGQRAVFGSEQEAADYISAARRQPRNAPINAAPVQLPDGRWSVGPLADQAPTIAPEDAPDAGQEPTGVLDGDVLNGRGLPFTTKSGAIKVAKAKGDGFEIVRVRDGFVVRQVNAAPEAAPNAGAPAATAEGMSESRGGTQPPVAPAPFTEEQGEAAPAMESGAAVEGVANEVNQQGGQGLGEPAPAPIEGQPINRAWSAFAEDSGTLGIPREQMPQVKAEHRGALVRFLGARGVKHEAQEVPADQLKPTQAEFSPAKVKQASEFTGGDRAILVSSDGYVLDGHHQWLAKRQAGEPVKVMRLDAPINDLLRLTHQFPSSTTAKGAPRAPSNLATGGAGQVGPAPINTRPGNAPGFTAADAVRALPRQEQTTDVPPAEQPAAVEAEAPSVEAPPAARGAAAAGEGAGAGLPVAGPAEVQAGGVATQPDGVNWWDSADKAARLDALKAAGWGFGKAGPSVNAAQTAAKAWADLKDSQRARIEAARAAPAPEPADPAMEEAPKAPAEPPAAPEPAPRAPAPATPAADGRDEKEAPAGGSEQRAEPASEPDETRAPPQPIAQDDAAEEGAAEAAPVEPAAAQEDPPAPAPEQETDPSPAQAPAQSELEAASKPDDDAPPEPEDQRAPAPATYTAADAEAAEKQLARQIEARIQAMSAAAVKAAASKLLPAFGVKVPIGKARIAVAAVDFSKVNPLAAAEAFGVEVPDAIRLPILAKMEGRLDQRQPARPETPPAEPPAPNSGKINDVGEKIGGARKDTVQAGATRSRRSGASDDRPAWSRRFQISQIVKEAGRIDSPRDEGRWVIRDLRSLDYFKQARQVGRQTFATREEAEAFLPIAAVSLKHRPVPTREGKYEIWRDITDRKRVKVVDQSFETREEAMAYMAANAVQIIETNTTFGEADMPPPPDRARVGAPRRDGNVAGDDFLREFGLRGVEFGNWNNQDERQALMNDAWDGLMDLAEVLGIPPRAIGLNGELALAFGARGQGLNSARAHYEPARAVINLTKERGAGSLAHEWFHAMDHYFGRQDGKAPAKWETGKDGTRTLKVIGDGADMASSGFSGARSGVREELRQAYTKVVTTMAKKAEAYVQDIAQVDKFTGAAREDLERALKSLRQELAAQKDASYYKRHNKPASAELLAEFDTLAASMLEGDMSALGTDWRVVKTGQDKAVSRWTNDVLERLSAIYKEVRGRTGFDSTNRQGVMDRLRGSMERYNQRLKMLAEAQAGQEKTRMVPTEFAMNARELDQGRGNDYWTTPHEMAARAFQGYVEDRIAEQGGLSRFLNYGPENVGILTPWGFKRPYPAGAERVAINKAFDGFVEALRTREDDEGRVALFSRSPLRAGEPPAKGVPMREARAIVERIRQALPKAPPIVLHRNVADAPGPLLAQIRADGAERTVHAAYHEGSIHVFPANMPSAQDMEFIVGHHEIRHHGMRTMLGPRLSPLLLGIYQGNESIKAAADEKIRQGLAQNRAHAVEEALADLDPNETARLTGFDKLAAMVRGWLRTMAGKLRGLGMQRLADAIEPSGWSDAEVAAFVLKAEDIAKGDGAGRFHGAGTAMSQTPAEEAALQALSQDDELFQLPKSDADTLEGILADTAPAVKVRKADLPNRETMWTLTMPDGSVARITQRPHDTYGPPIYGFESDGVSYQPILERPGDNAEAVPETAGDLWIDVSQLKEGGDGRLVYNAAANYAHNTGRIFIGDPSGLSDVALRRRAQHMLSSALKFGTTAHLAPAWEQMRGSKKAGVPPLRWTYGDHTGNIRSLIHVVLGGIENAGGNPITFRPDTGRFYDREGRELDGDSLRRAVREGRAREARAGDATSKSLAVLQALVREEGGGGRSQDGRPMGLLERLLAVRREHGAATSHVLYSRGLTADSPVARTLFSVKGATGDTLAHYRGLGMQALGRRQIVDLWAKELPHLAIYNDLVQRMDADKASSAGEADEVATTWGKLPDERALAELMHDATLARIDPAKDYDGTADRDQYEDLRFRWNQLTPGAQQIYRQARDTYVRHFAEVKQAIAERVERSQMSSDKRRMLLEKMDKEFFKPLQGGVYFPLARFGKYVVIVRDASGAAVSVSRAETLHEAQNLRAGLLKDYPAAGGYKVGKVLKDREFNLRQDGPGKGFMDDLYSLLEESEASEDLQDAVGQLYLQSLPDLSWAKHGIHRKGTPGFSQDARRAFAQHVFHGARYLAKLRYADRLQEQLTDMQEYVTKQAENEAFDSVKAQQVVDEMVKRHDMLMNPNSNPISTALTSFGFVFHLGLSPASAMVNLLQTPMVALPIMGARWGFTKASAALAKASQEAASNRNDLRRVLKGDEAEAFDEAVRTGVIDVTEAHDLAGIAEGEDSKVTWKLRPVMRWASFFFHHAERFNRQTTFIAAFRLAKEAGASNGVAYEQAVDATYKGHFDYSASNRPRFMQGNVAKVVLLFKQYAQNQIYLLARQAHLATKGLTAKERTEARRALAGLLTMQAAFAGALGMPMVGTILAAASWLGSDDDEPWDAEAALRNTLADAFGPTAADVMARGLSRLTPWDISGRVSLSNLIIPDLKEGLEGAQLYNEFGNAMLGPVYAIGRGVMEGLTLIAKGEYQRGAEAMLPAALRGPVKAFRYGSEGAVDRTGITILDEVDVAGVAGQVVGFSPSDVRRATEGRSAIYKADRALVERRSTLMAIYAKAAMAGDKEGMAEVREQIAAFNEKNPGRRITPQNLRQSMAARRRRIAEADQGIYLPDNRADARAAGRFAQVERAEEDEEDEEAVE